MTLGSNEVASFHRQCCAEEPVPARNECHTLRIFSKYVNGKASSGCRCCCLVIVGDEREFTQFEVGCALGRWVGGFMGQFKVPAPPESGLLKFTKRLVHLAQGRGKAKHFVH